MLFIIVTGFCEIKFHIYKKEPFDESGLITILSTLQLGTTAYLLLNIFMEKKKPVWILMALGFAYLAIDEYFQFHEAIDTLIHNVFNMKETPLTDRIDDVIIGIYGIMGILILIYYHNDFSEFKKSFIYFKIGFLLFFLSFLFDLISNGNNFFQIFIKNIPRATNLNYAVHYLEETLKVTSEAFFITTFYLCYNISKKNN